MSRAAEARPALSKVLCSIGSGQHAELLRLARRTFEPYAERHHYDVVFREQAASGRPAPWSKVPLLVELLDSYDLVLWLDADTMVLDPSRDIASELEPGRFLYLVRHFFDGQEVPNTGVMLVRSGPCAASFLEAVWSASDLVDHPWWDNAAVMRTLGYELPGWAQPGAVGRLHRLAKYRLGRDLRPARPVRPSRFRDATKFLPTEWNSVFYDMAPHPRILHWLGSPVEQRLADMRETLPGIEGLERLGDDEGLRDSSGDQGLSRR